MATYLTWGKTFCFHDGFVGLDNPSRIREKFDCVRTKGFENVGNSDPANLYFIDTLIKEFPKAHWILIKRNEEDCVKSSRKAFKNRTTLKHEKKQLEKLESLLLNGSVSGRILNFDSIDKCAATREFEFEFGWIPVERTNLFISMHIQLTEERLSRRELVNPELFKYADKKDECVLA